MKRVPVPKEHRILRGMGESVRLFSSSCPLACFLGWQLPELDLGTLDSVRVETDMKSGQGDQLH